MAENSKIEWTTHTFNPWRGCTKISDGCKNCYAETLTHRWRLPVWGPTAKRVIAADSAWRNPLTWDKKAKAVGERHRVFCASLADVFEGNDTCQDKEAWSDIVTARGWLWGVIDSTPNLDWLLLTKRPQNIMEMVPSEWQNGFPENVWIGTSVEDQKSADKRIPELQKVPAVVRFLSLEPLLTAVDLIGYLPIVRWQTVTNPGNVPLGLPYYEREEPPAGALPKEPIHWAIIGGESGPGARPFHLDWARDLVNQCQAAGVAPFVKQLGSQAWECGRRFATVDRKGGDINEFPSSLRVRRFPR